MTPVLTRAPLLLAGASDAPGLGPHRARWGPPARLTASALEARCRTLDVRGRGGAGFPFADKLAAVARRRGRPVVVVNASEGEPASHKDAVLVSRAPHLVLDGATATARALGAREVHLVTGPSGAPELEAAARDRDDRMRFSVHRADHRFVAGQSSAVLELLSGRPNLPATTWQPAARSGLRGRPTVLSNAETFALVGVLATAGPEAVLRHGTPVEPGTTLLTVDGLLPSRQVLEVAHGTPWDVVLPPERLDHPVLLGGFHGTWAPAGALRDLTVSRRELAAAGLALGAGVVLPADGDCPVQRTAEVVDYLAGQSAGRCGPCVNGLPALASAFRAVVDGHGRLDEVRRLAGLVEGRGACAHPDGTARLVRSLLLACPDEVGAHLQGRCCA